MAQRPTTAPGDAKPPRQEERRRLVTTIQMARKALALEDGSYRAILMRITGHDSSTTCTETQLLALVAEFKRLGFKVRPGVNRKPAPRNSKVRVIYAIWSEMAYLLDDPSQEALRSFASRQTGVDSIDWMNDAQCNQVIEGLRGWRENLKKERST